MEDKKTKKSSLLTALLDFANSSTAIKKAKNGYKYKYAPLEDIMDAIENDLINFKLVVSNSIVLHEGIDLLQTTVTHIPSGESTNSTARLIYKPGDIKDYGSSITYCRRYNLQCLLNLRFNEGDPDDKQGPKTTGYTVKVKPKFITKRQLVDLRQTLEDQGDLEDKILSWLNITDLSEMLSTRYKACKDWILKQLAAEEG
ncbi:MAG: ERF family protein [Candidatus Scalindua sp.]